MSNTSPDRDEASAAPEGPRNPWVSWLAWLVLAPVLYVLSAGPASWLAKRGYIPEHAWFIYFPLGYLPDGILDPIKHYAEWWHP